MFIGLLAGFLVHGNPQPLHRESTRPVLIATLAAGLTAWYFLDIMAASTFLGINQGLTSSTLLLVLLFLLAFIVTIMLEPTSRPNRSYDPVFLASAIIAVHGIGEGIAIGSILTTTNDPISAVGGPLSAASFVIHKGLEAFIAGAIVVSAGRYYSHIWTSGLIVGLPTVAGAVAGYILSPNSTVFYALGAGGALWLLSTLFATSMTLKSRFKWSLALITGVMLMFLAGILHSIR